MRRSRKAALSKGNCEGTEDFDSVGSVEVVEPDVVGDTDGLGVLLPPPERPISVLERLSRNCSLTLSLCSNEVSHETISGGSGAIAKCSGICSGTWEYKRLVSSSFDLSSSLERASDTSFSLPANHWA